MVTRAWDNLKSMRNIAHIGHFIKSSPPVRVIIDSIDSKVVELYLPELGSGGGECVAADVDVFGGVVTVHTEFAPDGHGRGEGVVCDVTFRAGTTDNVEDADEEWSSAWVVDALNYGLSQWVIVVVRISPATVDGLEDVHNIEDGDVFENADGNVVVIGDDVSIDDILNAEDLRLPWVLVSALR